ncbi:hypothetical protein [Arcticibacter eurypsychrophilus]|uniref:hypothetical protein n=1 Tax=Arcticibacter eurypsychrophilus TaxID=1434752 RepID=UPI00084D0707|nr:hypothetical protein [Arcticibacter eurypsychrophilus]
MAGLDLDFNVKLVYPYFIRQLPDGKRDVKDVQWIALVTQKELNKGQFVPRTEIKRTHQYKNRITVLILLAQ